MGKHMTAAQRAAAEAAKGAASAKPAGAAPAEPPERGAELGDAVQQERILENAPSATAGTPEERAALTVGGEPIALRALSGKRARQFVRLVSQIMSFALQGDRLTPMRVRLGIVLEEHEDLAMDFARFVARAEHPADTQPDDAAIEERAKEIDDRADFLEQAVILDQMGTLNRINEVFGARPKSNPTSETTKTA